MVVKRNMGEKCGVKTSVWFKSLLMGCQTLGTNITFHAIESYNDLYSSYLMKHAAVCTTTLLSIHIISNSSQLSYTLFSRKQEKGPLEQLQYLHTLIPHILYILLFILHFLLQIQNCIFKD